MRVNSDLICTLCRAEVEQPFIPRHRYGGRNNNIKKKVRNYRTWLHAASRGAVSEMSFHADAHADCWQLADWSPDANGK